MSSEYVRINPTEKVFGMASMLESQKLLLNINKRILIFQELRKEEFLFKTKIKQRIKEILENIKWLDKTLPKVSMHKEEKKEKKEEKEEEEHQEPDTIDEELEIIEKKLAELRSQF